MLWSLSNHFVYVYDVDLENIRFKPQYEIFVESILANLGNNWMVLIFFYNTYYTTGYHLVIWTVHI